MRYALIALIMATAAQLIAPTTAQAMYRDGPNLYQYVRSNPSRYTDPTGLAAMTVSMMTFGDNPSTCCAGKLYDPKQGCCIKDRLYSNTETTKVSICWRAARLPGGDLARDVFGANHMWLKTDFAEVGLGEAGAAGPPGGGSLPSAYPQTAVNDHTGQAGEVGARCITRGVPICCIAEQMKQRDTGKRCGFGYNCNTYVEESLRACGVDWDSVKGEYDQMEPTLIGRVIKGLDPTQPDSFFRQVEWILNGGGL